MSGRIRQAPVEVNGKQYTRFILDLGVVAGKRKRKSFKTEAAAKKFLKDQEQRDRIEAERQGILRKRIGERAKKLSTDDLHDATEAMGILQGATTLKHAATFWMDRNRPDGPTRSVDELVEDYIQSRVDAGRRPATIRDLRQRLGCANARENGSGRVTPFGFAASFKGVSVSHLTTNDLEKWLQKVSGGPSSKQSYRRHFVGLFNFASKRKYIRENPATALEVPQGRRTKPYVLPVEDCERLMATAASQAPDLVPFFAICLFAGIRPTEAQRLDWKDVNLKRHEIFIDSDISKTHDERWVPVEDNLLQWLWPHRKESGRISFSRKAFDQVRRKAGIRWAPDCMRHAYGSYHLAKHDNAGKTALNMGHRELGTLFEHYRRAVRAEDAERFFNIYPKKEAKILRMDVAG